METILHRVFGREHLEYPFERREFFDREELSFFKVLMAAVADRYWIFPKVRLRDLIRPEPRRDYLTYAKKIQSKKVDFVLCNRDSIRPLLVIELDKSRSNQEHQESLVDKALEAAGLPILYLPLGSGYLPAELFSSIQEKIIKWEPAARTHVEWHTTVKELKGA